MKNQFVSYIRRLFSVAYALFSNPQTVRLAILIVVVCFALAALAIPALSAVASGLPTGGSGSSVPLP